MAKSLEEIRQDYNMGNYSYRVEIPNKLPETHVFDENLSVKEIERAKENGIKTTTLGKRILRTETAAITLLAVTMFKLHELD